MTEKIYLSVHSMGSIRPLQEFFPRHRFHFVPFGIPTSIFPFATPRRERASGPIRIYSIGDDRHRDWNVILNAFGNDPRFRVRLVCRQLDASLL